MGQVESQERKTSTDQAKQYAQQNPQFVALGSLGLILFMFYMAYWLLQMLFIGGVLYLVWAFYNPGKVPQPKQEARPVSFSTATPDAILNYLGDAIEETRRRASTTRRPSTAS